MLNIRITLTWIFGVLFLLSITSITLGQQNQQINTALSESETIKIIREIHELEKNLIKEVHNLDTKILKEIHGLEIKMRDHVDNKINTVIILTITVLGVIGVPVILHFLKLTFPGIYFWQKKKKDVPEGIIDTSGEPLADNNNPLNQQVHRETLENE